MAYRFLAVSSNTPKIEGMLADAGLSTPMLDMRDITSLTVSVGVHTPVSMDADAQGCGIRMRGAQRAWPAAARDRNRRRRRARSNPAAGSAQTGHRAPRHRIGCRQRS